MTDLPTASWYTRRLATNTVQGGLRHDHRSLDAAVRDQMALAFHLDVPRTEAAHLAVALIRGYVATHPVASPGERAYDRNLRVRRSFNHAGRVLRRAAWNASRSSKAAALAFAAFAHPVHKPVENHTTVIREWTTADREAVRAELAAISPEQRSKQVEHLRRHLAAGDVVCRCNSDRVAT